MKKYEYKVEVLFIKSKTNILNECNKQGAEGWEAVGMNEDYILFKREKEEGN
ncbi:MAG: hypothetical protein ACRC28_16240 [Clostridium sp.]|uniref:hypothetical protein n=1 Tax=Clostridium sp. TaxID=1506 RepID=UPI003F3AE92B